MHVAVYVCVLMPVYVCVPMCVSLCQFVYVCVPMPGVCVHMCAYASVWMSIACVCELPVHVCVCV